MSERTYCVSTWDHERDAWTPVYRRVNKWGLRPVLRELYGLGWDVPSLQVLCEQMFASPEDAPGYPSVDWQQCTGLAVSRFPGPRLPL